MFKTYKYRLYPRPAQEKNLLKILACAHHFYNMCVGERKWTYALQGRSVTKKEQWGQVKHYKATFPQAKQVHSHVLQDVVDTVQEAYDGFFRRVKSGEEPGYPRFKGFNWFHSFGFKEYGNGFKLDGHRLRVFGAGRIPVRMHRPIPTNGKIKTCRIKHQAGQWHVSFAVEVPDVAPLEKTGCNVGLDMGISALITTSNGVKVENPNYYRAGQKKLRVLSRSVARKPKGSKNRGKVLRSVQRQHLHVANQRSDYLHKLSTALVEDCDGVALEDLATRNLVRNHHLSKSILDSGWGIFKEYLTYKAASAGRELRFVNPAYTSQDCSGCGWRVEKELSERVHRCPNPECLLVLDRDHNAAINILIKAGWDAPANANVDH
jgi:putative transposase